VLGALLLSTGLVVLVASDAARVAGGKRYYPDRPPSRIQSNGSEASKMALLKTYGSLPLRFEVNSGQTDSRVKFLSRGGGYTLFLTSTEAVLALGKGKSAIPARHPFGRAALSAPFSLASRNPAAEGTGSADFLLRSMPFSGLLKPAVDVGRTPNLESRAPTALRMRLVAANPSARATGLEETLAKSNYFTGKDPKKWRTNVPNFAKVKFENVYPGVDLVYYGNQGQLEYDFVVAPGVDPRAIKLAIQGASRLGVDAQGDLVADLGGEEVRMHKPVVYQPEESKSKLPRHNIEGSYVLLGENQVGFQVSGHDPHKALVIDPVVKYSTYLGGSGDDWASIFDFLRGIAVDSGGNAYVIGTTASTDFPTTVGGFQTTFGGGDGGCNEPPEFAGCAAGDVFVAKLSADGTLVYSTYLGGSADDWGEGIAVDAAGNAYLAGETASPDFPPMNPIQGANAGLTDMFFAKLNPAGSSLVYSTYLGGSSYDMVPMIALDSHGNLYFEGTTLSTDIPTANAYQPNTGSPGSPDIWAGKLNAAGNALVYSTYLGGSDWDVCGSDIVVDRNGDAYLDGFTCSTDFPTRNPIQGAIAGDCDAFLTKLNSGGQLAYSTYLGGSGFESTRGTAVDANGNAYFAGITFSSDFPTTSGAFDTAHAFGTCGHPPDTFPCAVGFVTKVNARGNALVYSTYLGGTGFDFAAGIVVDPFGNAYIAGGTYSTDFPTVTPLQARNAGNEDVFLTKLNPAGNVLVFSTYFGGSRFDEPSGLALGPDGDIYIQ
jgi:Beta-propeller repeat